MLLAALVGAALAAAGAAIQSVVRNVLADPLLLGISAGASVGAVTVTIGLGGVALSLAGGCLIFITPEMLTMLIGTSTLAIGHSMIAAAVTTSIARSRAELRSAAFAVNGVLQSAGTFLGPSLAVL